MLPEGESTGDTGVFDNIYAAQNCAASAISPTYGEAVLFPFVDWHGLLGLPPALTLGHSFSRNPFMRRVPILYFLILLMTGTLMARPLVIAHRGASGYLPEHTLVAAAYAHALGADYVEQDLVMSRDDVLVVLHDLHLETTTDVAHKFPERARDDGRFYAVDFDWTELRQLRVNERINASTSRRVYEQRYPATPGPFRLCTFEEQIVLIQGLNQSTGRRVGIYPEIKAPIWHAAEGKDLSRAVLSLLDRYGLPDQATPVFLQCFDPAELRRLRFELQTELPLIQLIGLNAWNHPEVDYDTLRTPAGLAEVATYADGIGPHYGQILIDFDATGAPILSSLITDAHAHNLTVHPYTFRADVLPAGVADFAALLDLFIQEIGIDGLFTDHPDLAVSRVNQAVVHP